MKRNLLPPLGFSFRKLAVFAAMVLLCAQGYAVSYTWTGAADAAATVGALDKTGNWAGNAVTFGTATDLTFYQAGSSQLNAYLGASNRIVQSLTFNASADSNFAIRLDDNAGNVKTLTLSAASGNASISVNAGAAGNITLGSTVIGSLILGSPLVIDHNGTGSLVIDRPITGAFALTKTGTGAVTLSNVNTYSGATTVSAGRLTVSSAQTGGGSFTVSDGATLSVTRAETAPLLNISSLALGSVNGAKCNFTLPVGLMFPDGNSLWETITTGTLTLKGTNTVDITGTKFVAGRFPLIKYTTLAGTGTFAVKSTGSIIADVVKNVATSTIDLVISSTDLPPSPVLTVSPDTVSAATGSKTVTLGWTVANLPANCTYAITTNRSVTYPSGGQTGPASNGASSVQAVVSGTSGSTVFTLSISNAAAQPVTSATTTVYQQAVGSLTRPNVLVVLYDDTGWGDFGCYGSPIKTSNIDALAAGGLRFREFYNCARCSPSRCALLTGNYPQQVGSSPTLGLPDLRSNNNITIPELLGSTGQFGSAGYRTYHAGKWHIGTTADKLSSARGFEHNFGLGTKASGANTTGTFGYWVESDFNLVSTEIPERIYGPSRQFHYSDAIGDYCVDFVNNTFVTHNGARPFFIYMPFNAPHWPVNGPGGLANKYTDVADPNPGDADIIHYEDGWDVIREQTYERQLAMGALKPGTALSPKSGSETPSGSGVEKYIDDWSTLSQAQRDDLARREAVYASMIELDDQNIGKVVTRLKELGQFDNTLIFILSDNGANYEGGEFGNSDASDFTPWVTTDLSALGQPKSAFDALGISSSKYARVTQGGAWANVSNVPFRLYKHFDHNGGIRSPMVVSWPAGMADSVKGTWTDERGHIIDIMATVADITGAARPTTFNGHPVIPLQGISLKPTFAGAKLPIRDLGCEHEKNRAYYRGNWKLVTKNFTFTDGSSPSNQLELYNMVSDPSELNNQVASQPVVLASMIDAWNAWEANVGLPLSYSLTSFVPPQISPAPISSDLFVDNFNRPNNTSTDASATGMSGTLLPSMGVNQTYYQGYQAAGAGSITVTGNGLQMSVGGETSENGLKHNFIDPAITSAGGFSVQMRIDDINAFTPDSNCYAGFAVGLTQAEAAAGADIASPGSFRGNGVNLGVADCFVELDYFGNVKMWSHGVLQVSVPTDKNSGTLLASFTTAGFAAGSDVKVTVFLDGKVVNLNSGNTDPSRTFTWQNNNANYIGLSTRVTAPAVSYVKLDNLAIQPYPLANALSSQYALNSGLNSPDNAPGADPDADGSSNLAEWLDGGQPGVNDTARHLLMLSLNPQGEFRFDHFQLTNAAQYGVTYIYQYSSDLTGWTTFTPETTLTQPDVPGYELVESRVPMALVNGKTSLFIRIVEKTDGSSSLPAGLVAPSAPAGTALPATD